MAMLGPYPAHTTGAGFFLSVSSPPSLPLILPCLSSSASFSRLAMSKLNPPEGLVMSGLEIPPPTMPPDLSGDWYRYGLLIIPPII